MGVSAVLVALTGCGTTRAADPHRPVRASAKSAAWHAAITIDPQIGETFAPAPASAKPRLTAQQAWARYTGETVIASGIRVRLGLLTLPVGPADAPGTGDLPKFNGEAYTALNELAYGYSAPRGCVTMNPRLLPPPGAQCLYWEFLNANTGKQIDSTEQKIGHWHWRIDPNGL